MIRLHIFLLQVAVITLSMLQICDGKVMMEYIGATGTPITSDPVPIEDGIDFHFILGFAIDADPSGKTQNGIGTFSPYWVDTLTPASVAAIKAKHSNVKALASLSGWSLGQKLPMHPFTPLLYPISNYGSVIDYVNHQFYTDKVGTPKGYLEAFRLRAEQFDRNKLLPSYEVNGRGIQGDAFFEALDLLKENGFEVNGEMIFSADASSTNNYYYERKSQAFLLNSTSV
uniref:GH18 domain-containing protein n=1 Tax=Quercus lobata TaxID=97700 RepID=A0A7N2R6M0_QUELO